MGLSTAEKNRRKRERKKKEKEDRRLEQQQQEQDAAQTTTNNKKEEEIEIEYVIETFGTTPATATSSSESSSGIKNDPSLPDGLPPLNTNDKDGQQPSPAEEDKDEDISAVLRRFHQRSAVAAVVTDDERKGNQNDEEGDRRSGRGSDDEKQEDGDDDDDDDDEENEDRKPMSKRKLREMIRPDVASLKNRVRRPDLVEAHDITATDPDFLIHLKGIPGTVPVPRHWGRKRKYLQGKRGFEKPPFKVKSSI